MPGHINGQYYRDIVLQKLLLAMRLVSANVFIFQEDIHQCKVIDISLLPRFFMDHSVYVSVFSHIDIAVTV